MTENDKGLGKSRRNATPPILPTPAPAPANPAPTQPLPVQPAQPAPTPAPTANPTAAAPAAHVGHRRRRGPAAHHPAAPAATPAPAAPAPADSDEPEGSPETEQAPPDPKAVAAAKEELKREAAEAKEKRKFKNRAKRAPKVFGSWLKAWARKHWFVTTVLVVAIIASLTMWVNGKFADDNAASSEPRLSAPKGIMPGGDEGSQRGSKADNTPTVKDNGDNLVFEYTDPNYKAVTFKVITDKDLNITEVKLGEKLKEYGGKLSIGTVDGSQESDVRCSRNAQVCDFSTEKINICKSWMSLSRIIPIAGGSDQNQPFWTALEVYNANPVGTYSGSTDLPHHCGVKDSDTSS